MSTLVFGDSIASDLKQKDWIVSAYPGETTFSLVSLLKDELCEHKDLKKLILLCGQNDEAQGLTAAETVANLVAMQKIALTIPILLSLPRCIGHQRRDLVMDFLLDYLETNQDQQEIEIFNPWQELDICSDNWKEDGAHLSDKGVIRLTTMLCESLACNRNSA